MAGDAARLVECLSNMEDTVGFIPTTEASSGGAHLESWHSGGGGRATSSRMTSATKRV